MIEITGGNKYMDIDAYASCIAYAKLLNSLNIKAKAVTTAKNNNQLHRNLQHFYYQQLA